jgi:hypothetical protein
MVFPTVQVCFEDRGLKIVGFQGSVIATDDWESAYGQRAYAGLVAD